MLPSLWAWLFGDVEAAFLCCLCRVFPRALRSLLDAGWGMSARVAPELGALPAPGGFGLQALLVFG